MLELRIQFLTVPSFFRRFFYESTKLYFQRIDKLAADWKGESFKRVESDSLPENFQQLLDLQDFYQGELALPEKYHIKES